MKTCSPAPRLARALACAVALAPLALLAASCGGAAAEGTSAASGGDACTASAARARDRVLAAVEANRACNADADCRVTEIHASCFDVCTRSVSVAGLGAVEAAMAAADHGDCNPFTAATCTLTVPPCAPPAAPACKGGKCN